MYDHTVNQKVGDERLVEVFKQLFDSNRKALLYWSHDLLDTCNASNGF